MEKRARICVAGAKTMIGAAILRELRREGFSNITSDPENEPDFTDANQVDVFFERAAPEYVFVAAGRSGGIQANLKYPADFIRDNLLASCHIIHSAYRHRVTKLLYLASSCIYPRACPQPMKVTSILTGPLEPTNEAYAEAKIAGIKMCQAYRQQFGINFISAIAANNFGPGDDFDPEDSHVIGALIRKMHEARESGTESVEIWGTGGPRREFMFVDDLADACVYVMRRYDGPEPINLGSGCALSIREVAALIREVVGYTGELSFDPRKPDGMPVKLLDSSRLREMGWKPKTPMRSGLAATYQWFLESGQGKRTNELRAVL